MFLSHNKEMSKFHVNFVIWQCFKGCRTKYWKILQHFLKEAINMAYKLNISGILVSSLLLTFEILPLKYGIFLA
jgi:alpha-amylase/alpha-mannosidase (GH57 family)